jgi:hypothetical protein
MADERGRTGAVSIHPSGRRVRGEGSQTTDSAFTGFKTATACFELHAIGQPGQPSAVFEIQLVVNPNTYPFTVLEGSIRGDICQVIGTAWKVTSASFDTGLLIEAERVPLEVTGDPLSNASVETALPAGSECMRTMSLSGSFHVPDSYSGEYGFDGSNSDFQHTTLFKGWQACS